MIKKLLILIFSVMFLGAPASYAQDVQKTQIENEQFPITITVYGANINVKNAQNMMLEVYDITGKKVAAMRVDSQDKTFELSVPKGCYIVKIGNIARKVYLKDR